MIQSSSDVFTSQKAKDTRHVNWTLIIPSYNSFPCIRDTIESVLALNGAERIAEIVVVDSSDDEPTRNYLRGLKDGRLRLVLLDERRVMPSRQRNIGVRHATGDALAFIDADIRLHPDWLLEADKTVEHGFAIGGGSIDLPESQRRSALAAAQFFLQFNEFLPGGERRAVDCLPSANLFCTRELFDRLGGFPAMRASEDVVFTKRANEQTQVWFVPLAKSFHTFRTQYRPFLRNQAMLGEFVITYRKLLHQRWVYAGPIPLVLLPAILAVKALRMTRRVFRAGRGYRWKFVRSLPLFALGLLAWGWGWAKGCVNGRARRVHEEMNAASSAAIQFNA